MVYSQEAFFERLSCADVQLSSKIMPENKNPLRLFKNHFCSSHRFTSIKHTNLLVLQFSSSVMLYWYAPTRCCRVFVHSLTSLLHQHCGTLDCVLHRSPCIRWHVYTTTVIYKLVLFLFLILKNNIYNLCLPRYYTVIILYISRFFFFLIFFYVVFKN